MSFNKEKYKSEKQNVISLIKQTHDWEKTEGFIADGIINPDIYANQKIKILVLLAESYGYDGHGIVDIEDQEEDDGGDQEIAPGRLDQPCILDHPQARGGLRPRDHRGAAAGRARRGDRRAAQRPDGPCRRAGAAPRRGDRGRRRSAQRRRRGGLLTMRAQRLRGQSPARTGWI